MDRSQVKVGDRVYFGRANGEQTLGEVTKKNAVRAKVKTLEGRGRHSRVGVEWSVPYSMLTPAGGNRVASPLTPTAPKFTPIVPGSLDWQFLEDMASRLGKSAVRDALDRM